MQLYFLLFGIIIGGLFTTTDLLLTLQLNNYYIINILKYTWEILAFIFILKLRFISKKLSYYLFLISLFSIYFSYSISNYWKEIYIDGNYFVSHIFGIILLKKVFESSKKIKILYYTIFIYLPIDLISTSFISSEGGIFHGYRYLGLLGLGLFSYLYNEFKFPNNKNSKNRILKSFILLDSLAGIYFVLYVAITRQLVILAIGLFLLAISIIFLKRSCFKNNSDFIKINFKSKKRYLIRLGYYLILLIFLTLPLLHLSGLLGNTVYDLISINKERNIEQLAGREFLFKFLIEEIVYKVNIFKGSEVFIPIGGMISPHNIFLNILINYGLLAFILQTIFVLLILWRYSLVLTSFRRSFTIPLLIIVLGIIISWHFNDENIIGTRAAWLNMPLAIIYFFDFRIKKINNKFL